ncbi:MAG: hypothetical protein VX185_12305 [Pseudomonadota bacterium]|nr:hypothetical protein [Pseudomonadota bacterium]
MTQINNLSTDTFSEIFDQFRPEVGERDVTHQSSESDQQKILLKDKNAAFDLQDLLNLELPNGAQTQLESVETTSGELIGYQLSILSENGESISVTQNEDGQFVLQMQGGKEITIPDELAEEIIAMGNDEVDSLLGSGGQGKSESNVAKEWGKLAEKFESMINPTTDWQPGDSISFEGDSFSMIQDAKDDVAYKFDDTPEMAKLMDQAILHFAAEQGFLDDGVIEEFEASEIAAYMDSDKFEELLNVNQKMNNATPSQDVCSDDEVDRLQDQLDKMFNPDVVAPDGDDQVEEIEDKPKEIDMSNMTDMQKAYHENRDTFKTIANNFGQWCFEFGGDDKVSIKDLEIIRDDESRPQDERDAAKFLLENDSIRDSIDTAGKGGSTDGKLSVQDFASWMDQNQMFGQEFTSVHVEQISNLSIHWNALSGGDDELTLDDLRHAASDPKDDNGNSIFSEQERESAQFLLDNMDYFFFLDMHAKGFQNLPDGKISLEDFSKISDGVISSKYNQASEGNCWALTGFFSLGRTTAGAEAIQESVRKGDDGKYYVKFAGDPDQKEYEVTPQDLADSGFTAEDSDIDMQVLNIALNKFVKDKPGFLGLPEGGTIGEGGNPVSLYKLIMGHGDMLIGDKEEDLNFFKENADKINNGDMSVAIDAEVKDGNIGANEGTFHAFTVVGVDNENGTIQYVNPWEGNEVKEISFEDFEKYFDESKGKPQINYTDHTQ